MAQQQDIQSFVVVWRGKKFIAEMSLRATLKDLGEKMLELTNIKAETMRLLVPTDGSSKLLYPFSDEHSRLSLESASLMKGKSIRMMGVPKNEVEEVLQNEKKDLRIAGFDEEEKRLRQMSDRSNAPPKLPQGTYVFCDFQTLNIPGIELNPPATEALKLLHMLASDLGIVAIMNKHRWRVGVLTEMAPVGYVGVSPKCILGFNKNHGEEISLRLRTDDLKGFRKYESIKKTLLHELAHMVYSEHDADFYALDNQLNKEAATLDWTKSRGHTLNGARHSQSYGEQFTINNNTSLSQKLGGQASFLPSARESSVAAAYRRLADTSSTQSRSSNLREEVQPNDGESGIYQESFNVSNLEKEDPNRRKGNNVIKFEPYAEFVGNQLKVEPDPEDCVMSDVVPALQTEACKDPDPNNLGIPLMHKTVAQPDHLEEIQMENALPELIPDDSGAIQSCKLENVATPDETISLTSESMEVLSFVNSALYEPNPDDSQVGGNMGMRPILDDIMVIQNEISRQTEKPETDDEELQRIKDPVYSLCDRLQNAIDNLKDEISLPEVAVVLQTLFIIISNVIEHPNEMKFKRLRKTNPTIQRHVVNHRAAMEFLVTVGFCEDVVVDDTGKAETFLVLKRNDPGLLWLAKSSVETSIV